MRYEGFHESYTIESLQGFLKREFVQKTFIMGSKISGAVYELINVLYDHKLPVSLRFKFNGNIAVPHRIIVEYKHKFKTIEKCLDFIRDYEDQERL